MSTLQGTILGAIIAAFAMLGLMILLQHHQLTLARAQYENALKNSSALQAENLNWKRAAEAQNKKLADLAARQTQLDAMAAKAMHAAEAKSKSYQGLAAQVAAYKSAADDCTGATQVKDFYMRHKDAAAR